MDTISRENTSSPLPLVGVIAGVIGVILAAVALVKVGSTNKAVADHESKLGAIAQIQTDVSKAQKDAQKASSDIRGLQESAQSAITTLAGKITEEDGRIQKLEESRKAPAAAAGKGGGGPVTAGPGEYLVKAGDNPTKIGAEHGGFSAADVIAVNPGMTPSNLKVGQKIKLPTRGGAAAK